MIGGADITLEGPTTNTDADFLVRGLQNHWPNALIQDANQLEAVSIHSFVVPAFTHSELLIYKDAESYASWQADGATDANQNAMVHVIISGSCVTAVVDRTDSELAATVRALLSALQRRRTA